MDWNLFGLVMPILFVIVLLVLLYGAYTMWKTNSKFLAFIFIALAVACGILGYSLYGHQIFG